jgi:uncharacterized protein (DUF2252 family)
MSSCEALAPAAAQVEHDVAGSAADLASSLELMIAAGRAKDVPDASVRRMMAALVKVYAAKVDRGDRPALLDPDSGVSATAVLVAASALLKASNLEIFELGMWQSWSGSR